MFSVGRVIAVPKASMRPRRANGGGPTKTVLCGQRRHTPCRGKEAHQPPPESERIPFAVAGEKVFRHTFSHRFLMWGRIYFKQIALGLRLLAPPKDWCFDTKLINSAK